jgi:hypothetical protein
MSNQDTNASQRLDADHLRHFNEKQERRFTEFLDKSGNQNVGRVPRHRITNKTWAASVRRGKG